MTNDEIYKLFRESGEPSFMKFLESLEEMEEIDEETILE